MTSVMDGMDVEEFPEPAYVDGDAPEDGHEYTAAAPAAAQAAPSRPRRRPVASRHRDADGDPDRDPDRDAVPTETPSRPRRRSRRRPRPPPPRRPPRRLRQRSPTEPPTTPPRAGRPLRPTRPRRTSLSHSMELEAPSRQRPGRGVDVGSHRRSAGRPRRRPRVVERLARPARRDLGRSSPRAWSARPPACPRAGRRTPSPSPSCAGPTWPESARRPGHPAARHDVLEKLAAALPGQGTVATAAALAVILAALALLATALLARVDPRRPWAAAGWALAPVLLVHWLSWDLVAGVGVAVLLWGWATGRPWLAGVGAGIGAAFALPVAAALRRAFSPSAGAPATGSTRCWRQRRPTSS